MIWMKGAAVAALLACGRAVAQDGASEADDVVIVTAKRPTSVGKLDVPLKDQPQNVTVINRTTLDHFGKARIQDIAYATVGLQPVAMQQGATSYGFFLRGFNGAPIITDGYYSSNNAFGSVGIIDMSTVESVEVLRGPASLLYGQGNPGGVVNLTSKQPLNAFGAAGEFIFDDQGTRRFEGDVTGPIADGIGVRINAVAEDSDTFRDFIEQERYLLSPALTARLDEDVTLRVRYTYDDFRFTPDNGPGINPDLIEHLPVERSVQEPGLGKIRAVNQNLRADADWRFADGWTFRAGAFWHQQELPRGTAEIDPDVTLDGTTIGRVFISTIEPDNNGAEDYMLTAQILGRFETFGIDHNLTAAADYIDNRSKYDYAYYAFSPIDYANPVYTRGPVVPNPDDLLFDGEGAFKSTVEAFYAQDLISLGEQWKVLLGVRRETIKTTGYADPNAEIVTSTTKASKTTPRAGIVFEWDDTLTLYGSYSESFVPNYGLNFAGDAFKPEESRSYELGLRKQFGNDLLLTVALYDIEKKNILVVDPVHDSFNINAGVARSKGVEAELQGRLTENWRVGLGLAYNDAKITQSADPLFFPEGDTLPAAMHWSALANTDYAITEGTLAGLEFGINVSYASERPYVLPNNGIELDPYVKVDLYASYQLTNEVSAQVNINNLTDERILLANGYGRVQFDVPRTVFLTLRYRMGALAD